MIFFTDECISPRAAYMLDQFDRKHAVRAFPDSFGAGTPDVEWMREVASWDNDVVVVCGDGRILRNNVEKKVLKGCGFKFVYLAPGWTNLKWDVFAWKIIKVWPDIIRNIEQARYPLVLEVTVGLKVQSWGRIDNL